MATWKKFDQVDTDFYDFHRPAQPAGKVKLGFWELGNTYTLESIIKGYTAENRFNYTQLADKNDAKRLADSLASRFLVPSLVGTLGKWAGYYEVKKEGDEVVAKYNLQSGWHPDYKRHVEYKANTKTGKVDIKYVTEEPVPEKVIAKDMYMLYVALGARKGYFTKRPATAPGTTPATTTAPATPTTQTTTAPAGTETPATPTAPPANAGAGYDALPDAQKNVIQQAYDKFKNLSIQDFYAKVLPVYEAGVAALQSRTAPQATG